MVNVMDKLEKVEKLREKTGVTYEDAKAALEACDYDMLDAIIYLEKLDKIKKPDVDKYTTESSETYTTSEFDKAQEDYKKDCSKKTLGNVVDGFMGVLKKLLKKSIDTKFEVVRYEETVINVPVLVLVIALIFAFWVVLPLLIVGMFFDFKYHFAGINSVNVNINEMCDKAADACTDIKNDMKSK